jgi:hypothetical protein
MYTTLHDEAPMDMAHYTVNLLPRGREYAQRPPVRRHTADTINSSTIQCAGTRISGSTYQGWILTDEPAIYEIEIDTIPSVTARVTAANFTSAGVTASDSTHWVQYLDDIVFVQDDGVPWTWDGTTGAGSLTNLTNAGNVAAYTAPAVYYGKLFFIKSSDRRVIVWSEENDAATGYEAGDYNNAWTLSQTNSHPLLWILGANNGLYYWRDDSIGMIQGAVTPDFSTTGTHDGVSTSTGIYAPTDTFNGAVFAGGSIWFAGSGYGIYRLPVGGKPELIEVRPPDEQEDNHNEPFGFIDEFYTQSTPKFWGCFALPGIGQRWKDVVGFSPADSSSNVRLSMLLFDAKTGTQLGWARFYHNTGNGTLNANVRGVIQPSRPDQFGAGVPILGDVAASTRYFTWGFDDGIALDSGPDENAAGTLQSTVYRLIGPPIGFDPGGNTAWHFDEMRVKVFGEGTVSGTAQYLTSEKSYQDEVDTAQAWTTTHDTTHRDARLFELGIDENGRWLRPVIALSSNSIDQFGIGDMSVVAYSQPIEELGR